MNQNFSSMKEQEYIEQRLDDQINWYDKKSIWNQKRFKHIRIVELISASSIPFLAGFRGGTPVFMKILIGFLDIVIAVLSGLLSLYQYERNWIAYCTTCETLKSEKFLYLAKTEPYNCEKPYSLLVQRIESLISKENKKWSCVLIPVSATRQP